MKRHRKEPEGTLSCRKKTGEDNPMGREKFRKCIQRATKELFPERIK